MKPSLFVSLLRHTKNDDPKFRETQSVWVHRLKQRAIIFTSIGLVGFAVYWLQSRPASKNVDTTEQIKEADASTMLQRSKNLSTRDLIYMANEMEFDPNAPLPVIMEFIKNRSEIADKLLAKTDDARAQKEGTLYRIEALQNLSKLNRTHEMGYSTVNQQLYELCSANLSHGDSQVSKMAAVAIMITALDEFSYEPTSANLNNALSKCNQIASQLGDDAEIARALFTYARMKKRSELTVDDATDFFQVVVKHFYNSGNEDARDYAERSYREIVFGDESGEDKFRGLLVAGLKDRFRQKRRSVERELSNRVRFALHPELFDSTSLNQLIQLLEILPSVEKFDTGAELASDILKFAKQLENKPLQDEVFSKLNEYEIRVNAKGSSLDFSGVSSVNSDSVDFRPDSKTTALLYWSPNQERSEVYLRAINNMGIQRVAQCIVFVTEYDDKSQKMARKLNKEMDGFKFVFERQENRGSGFSERFPVPKVPYLILLDSDLKIVSINPGLRGLPEKIEQLIR